MTGESAKELASPHKTQMKTRALKSSAQSRESNFKPFQLQNQFFHIPGNPV